MSSPKQLLKTLEGEEIMRIFVIIQRPDGSYRQDFINCQPVDLLVMREVMSVLVQSQLGVKLEKQNDQATKEIKPDTNAKPNVESQVNDGQRLPKHH